MSIHSHFPLGDSPPLLFHLLFFNPRPPRQLLFTLLCQPRNHLSVLVLFSFFCASILPLSLSYTSSNLHILLVASFSFGFISHSLFNRSCPSTMDAAALLCNICPKRPRFSDVSHLLTHVSSKAHLSHYFKLQVRSHQEPQAGQLLEEYDRWYKVNNLAKLLSDRMASKETRHKRRQVRAVAQGASFAAPKENAEPRATPRACTSTRKSFSDFLDPHLSDFKIDTMARDADPPSFSTDYIIPTRKDEKKIHLRLNATSALGRSPEMPAPGQLKRDYDSDSEDEIGSILRATPHWSGRHGSEAKDEIDPRLLQRGFGSDPFIDEGGNLDSTPTMLGADRERADEIARLKGVLWPGMDIFDSATEQMRRKRNQKKDESVLKMMEKTSLGVEPTELVFSPSGILRKQRVINGDVEDSSPLKGETPIPKRRAVRPKRLLFTERDPNIVPQRGQDVKRIKRVTGVGPSRHSVRDAANQIPVSRGGVSGNQPLRNGDDEFDLSLRGFGERTRGGFAVFNDKNQGKSSSKDQRHGDGPYLASSMPRQETLGTGPFQPPASSNYAAGFIGRAPCHPMGKENLEPILNIQGRIDTIDNWRSPFIKRNNYIGDTGYPPHYFFSDAPRPAFGPLDSHDLSGYSWNPLAISLPRLPAQEKENHNIYKDISPTFDCQPATRAGSPDGTISDTEQDDFERLYLDGSSY